MGRALPARHSAARRPLLLAYQKCQFQALGGPVGFDRKLVDHASEVEGTRNELFVPEHPRRILRLWSALANVYPEAGEQRCWNQRMDNVLDRMGKSLQPTANVWLRQVMYTETLSTTLSTNRCSPKRVRGLNGWNRSCD
jgi:hypothetical protein